MKSNLRKMLWVAIAVPVAGIVAVGILRAQQPPIATAPPTARPPAQSVRPPVAASSSGAVYAPSNFTGLYAVPQPGQPVQLTLTEVADPELNELRQSAAAMSNLADGLAAQYAATEDGEKRAAIKAELLNSLTQQFEAQQQVRERELANVEARVKKLRELTQKRRDAQKTIIDQRLDQLLREADGLGWTAPANGYDAVVHPKTMSGNALSPLFKPSQDSSPRR